MHSIKGIRTLNTKVRGFSVGGVSKSFGGEHPQWEGVDNSLPHSTLPEPTQIRFARLKVALHIN